MPRIVDGSWMDGWMDGWRAASFPLAERAFSQAAIHCPSPYSRVLPGVCFV